MSAPLKTQHPLLMVPFVYSFSVIVYGNASQPKLDLRPLRQALIDQLPPGCGVSDMVCTHHGVYTDRKDKGDEP